MERVWDKFLTEQDKASMVARPKKWIGFGQRAAVLSVDNYRKVIGDKPEPLLDAIKTWPSSVGLAGWEALEHTKTLFSEARAVGLPIVHLTGLTEEESGMQGWSTVTGRTTKPTRSPEEEDRYARRYDIVEQAAPVEGEVVLKKVAPSGFHGTPLVGYLNQLGVDTLIIAGESTSGCVRATVVDAVSYRYRVIVVEECVYDRHELAHAANLFDMHFKYADVLPLAEVLDWVRDQASGNPA